MTASARPLAVSQADPYSLDTLRDPASFHAELRESGSVVYLEKYDVFAMGRYEHVHSALTDWQSFQSSAGVGITNYRVETPVRPPSILIEADPPRHDATRSVLSKILGPRALHKLRESWAPTVDALVDEVVSRSVEFDAVTELSNVLPLGIFADAVGLPVQGREHLLPMGDFVFNSGGPLDSDLMRSSVRRVTENGSVEWSMLHCQRDALSDDGLGAKIWSAADRGDITHEQAPMVVRSILSAGFDTTASGLAAVLYAFALHPDQWNMLCADPRLARTAFDEAVRWESPVQTFYRTTTSDIDVDGVRIPDGRKVLLSLGSANHDPRRWDDPDAFDIARDPSGHVGFGMGIHQCVGQHVARLEAELLLSALTKRVKSIGVAGSARRHLNNTLRSWESIPVRITRR